MMNHRPLLFALRALLLLALCALPFAAHAQSATLSGTIEDQNKAAIPGVQVTIENTGTTLKRETTTNHEGSFTVPLLPPGHYVVTARRDGFAPVQINDVVLNVGDQKALKIQLKAGDVNATVTVDLNAETVRTDGSVGTVINRQFVANMPLNGRSLHALIQLTPGVVLTTASGSPTGNGQFSVNGQRTTSNYFMVDGVSANTGMATSTTGFPGASGSGQTPGATALGGTNSLVSLDALQEFRIETSTFAPEFGRTPGGQISLVSRGGTNQYHGSASEYLRNEAMDANNWFANANRQPKPKERQNLFGGVFGGPIKKDRLFFFGSYEGLRLQQPVVSVLAVPTAALRAQTPPALLPYLNALPLPNGQDFGNGTGQLTASYSNPGRFNIFSIRLDGRVTDKLTTFFRYNHAPSEVKARTNSLSTVVSTKVSNDVYTGGVTWVTGAGLTADLRVGWTRNAPRAASDLDAFGGAVVPNASDIFAPGRDPSKSRYTFFFAGGGSFVWGTGIADVQRQLNAVGTVAYSTGAHQLKLGVDYRRLLPLFGATGGQFEFSFFFNRQAILNQQAFVYQITNAAAVRKAVISNLSIFAQDTWRVKSRLTLTYGVRFERVPPPGEAAGNLPRTVLGIESSPPQNPRLAPEGTPLFHGRFGEFAPRFGIAYQLGTRSGWGTTLRGGVGIYPDLGLGDIATAFQNIYPFFASKSVSFAQFPLSASVRTPPVLGVDPPQQFHLLDPNIRMPYTIEWNAAWEQGVGKAQTVTVAYVGAAGRRLLANQSYLQPLAEWPTTGVPLYVQRNLSRSSYHALQMQYQRRLYRGVQVLAFYALSRSRDNKSSDTDVAPPADQAAFLAQEYGPSDFDVRHVLSAAVSYDVPKLRGSALVRALTRGWGLDLLFRQQSAFPVTPLGFNLSLPSGASFSRRPDRVAGQPLYIYDSTLPGGRTFNLAAFADPAPGLQGNFPRNGLRGFPASQVDLALRREFKLEERVRLQLRGELFNLFNHPNFGAPDPNTFDGTRFGKPTSMLNQSLGGLNALYQMGGPRSMQLSLRLSF